MDTVIAGGRLTSFAWHDPAAVQAARRADRLGRRTRLGRWAWVPVPIGMRGPEAARSAEVVVGVGGYVAVPAYLAARRQGLPIVVHEANAWPGVAGRENWQASGAVLVRSSATDPIPALADLGRVTTRPISKG